MDRKTKLRVIGKLLDAGYDDEKKVINFGLRDMQVADVKSEEICVLLELQEATKNHKVISFLADEVKKKRKSSFLMRFQVLKCNLRSQQQETIS